MDSGQWTADSGQRTADSSAQAFNRVSPYYLNINPTNLLTGKYDRYNFFLADLDNFESSSVVGWTQVYNLRSLPSSRSKPRQLKRNFVKTLPIRRT